MPLLASWFSYIREYTFVIRINQSQKFFNDVQKSLNRIKTLNLEKQ